MCTYNGLEQVFQAVEIEGGLFTLGTRAAVNARSEQLIESSAHLSFESFLRLLSQMQISMCL